MKFLCVACDEPMKLEQALGPDDGSMSVIFACPACGRKIAMLTNAMETQMVRSLGVKIGGKGVPSEPMEMVRGSLAQSGAGDRAPDAPQKTAPPQEGSGSKCPFTGVVAGAYAQQDRETAEITWTKAAEERIARIPSFAQPMVKMGVEMHAREHGYTEISEAVLDEVKDRFGM